MNDLVQALLERAPPPRGRGGFERSQKVRVAVSQRRHARPLGSLRASSSRRHLDRAAEGNAERGHFLCVADQGRCTPSGVLYTSRRALQSWLFFCQLGSKSDGIGARTAEERAEQTWERRRNPTDPLAPLYQLQRNLPTRQHETENSLRFRSSHSANYFLPALI